jgi:hypothetical protein
MNPHACCPLFDDLPALCNSFLGFCSDREVHVFYDLRIIFGHIAYFLFIVLALFILIGFVVGKPTTFISF